MEILDGDNVKLSHNGRVCDRDIVQFVPFREYQTQERLAKKVMAEIPKQLTLYMKKHGIEPILRQNVCNFVPQPNVMQSYYIPAYVPT